MSSSSTIFATLKTEDRILADLQKRIDKLSLMQVWAMKALALLNRYMETLNRLSSEPDNSKHGLMIEEIDICFMSSVSYFLRCFLHQKGSYCLEIKEIAKEDLMKKTYRFLYDLRNDEYVHWKGLRSNAFTKYSFKAVEGNQCEFGAEINVSFHETVGPSDQFENLKTLYSLTLSYIEDKRNQEIQKLRARLASPDAWVTTHLLNDLGQDLIKKT